MHIITSLFRHIDSTTASFKTSTNQKGTPQNIYTKHTRKHN